LMQAAGVEAVTVKIHEAMAQAFPKAVKDTPENPT
jgi:hypothetical protein